VDSAAECKGAEAPVALATEAALDALQGSNADLQAQIDALNGLARRLHGNQAAVINDIIAGSGQVRGTPGGFVITLVFCDRDFLDIGSCNENTGIVLESPLVTDNEEGSIITFDAGNTPGFATVVDLVANGENDIIQVQTRYIKGDGSPAGGGSTTGFDSSYFYRDTQTTTGPGFSDLLGLDVDRIDISIDRVLLFFDEGAQKTTIDIDYRIFFGLAP
jgi:hypothetical protein